MKKAGVVLFVLMLAAGPVFASDPARAFLPAGAWGIDWDIGFRIPPGWPPYPASGGPGLRYSPTDAMAVGLQIHIAPLFERIFDADLFFSWNFLRPEALPVRLSATGTVCMTASGGVFRIKPSAGLSFGFGSGVARGYLSADVALWFPVAGVPPWVELTARTGIVFPSVQNLSIEFGLIDLGRYSSVTRTWFGQPVIAVGMVNPF